MNRVSRSNLTIGDHRRRHSVLFPYDVHASIEQSRLFERRHNLLWRLLSVPLSVFRELTSKDSERTLVVVESSDCERPSENGLDC